VNVPRTPNSTIRLGVWHPASTSTIPQARKKTKHTNTCHGDDEDRLVQRCRGVSRRSARNGPKNKQQRRGNTNRRVGVLPRRFTIQQVKRPGSCAATGYASRRRAPRWLNRQTSTDDAPNTQRAQPTAGGTRHLRRSLHTQRVVAHPRGDDVAKKLHAPHPREAVDLLPASTRLPARVVGRWHPS